MRIGMLTTSYPRYPGDPAGSFVAEMAAWLAGSGDQIEVLAPAPARADPAVPAVSVRPVAAPRGGLFYGAGAPDNLRRWKAWAQVPSFVGRLASECHRRSLAWEVVVSHWLLPSAVLAELCARGRPHLAIAHSSEVHLLRRIPGLGAALLGALAARGSSLVLTSESLRPLLLEQAVGAASRRLLERARVLRMGVAVPAPPPEAGELRRRQRRALGLEEQAPVLLFLGRLVPVKGLDLLLRASAGLPGLVLLIAGGGPERVPLQQQARALGLDARFLGEQTGSAKRACLAAADLLVLPSRVLADGRTESAPLVLLEAMAAGLPVLATRVGGNVELIEDGRNGLLVAPEVSSLRAALRRLLEDRSLRLRLAGAGRISAAEQSWDRLGPCYRQLLCDLVGARPGRPAERRTSGR